MRILISGNPMYGHINTLLPLALAAQRSGHQVAVATGPDMVRYVERRGLVAWPVGSTFTEARDAEPELSVDFFIAAADKRAIDLVPRAADWMPDLVVHEETELAGPVAAALTGARHVVHGLGLMPPLRIWAAFEPAIEALFRQWDVPASAATLRDATYLHICPPSLQLADERIWSRVVPLRPSAGEPVAGEQLPEAMLALPYDRTAHLTLGTVFNDGPDVLAAAIAGLQQLPINVVVTTGPGIDPTRFGPQPAHVLIQPYVPHSLLLPFCQLVVSQGGAGILFSTLAHGLPQLIIPQGADQFMNADAVQAAGAALSLAPGNVTAETVAASATRLLAEPEFATAARSLRAEIDAMPDANAVLGAVLPTKGKQTADRRATTLTRPRHRAGKGTKSCPRRTSMSRTFACGPRI